MKVGDIIEILDLVDYTITHKGTIRMIEPCEDIPDLYWIYIRANDCTNEMFALLKANEEELNTNYDDRIGSYWTIVTNQDDHIVSISPATI